MADEDDSGTDRLFVGAVARAFDILELFKSADAEYGNQEIAQLTGLPKPTVVRLTYTLTKLGHLIQRGQYGKFRLGAKIMSLGLSYISGLDIRDFLRPHMRELAIRTNTSVSLAKADHLEMVFIETSYGEGHLVLRREVGYRAPLATTALGRAFYAGSSPAEQSQIERLIEEARPDDCKRQIEGLHHARQELQDFGFTKSVGEWQPEIYSVGVPVLTSLSPEPLALNCAAPSFVIGRAFLERELGPQLAAVAKRLQDELRGKVAGKDR